MSSPKGVREYNRIRRYLERIYLYGFFSREDFARAKIGSVKDYDYGVKLIRSVFPETENAALWKDGRKYLRVQRQYALSGENRMADSYLLYAMDAEDELPTLLGMLSGGDQGASLQKAAQSAARGNPAELMRMMNQVMQSPAGAELVQRINQSMKRN